MAKEMNLRPAAGVGGQDMFLVELHEAVRNGLGRVPALRDTIVLLKVWSRQQSLAEPDGFGGFLLSAFAVHLANIGTLVGTPPPLPSPPPPKKKKTTALVKKSKAHMFLSCTKWFC